MRLIIISKKQLPRIAEHGKYFAFVDQVSYDVEDIKDTLDPHQYVTKTLGERRLEGMRPAGDGVYAIVEAIKHGRKHSHLAYVLENPKELGPVQRAFNIDHEGSFVINVKNPKGTSSFLKTKGANYPPELQQVFEDRNWNIASPLDLLDYEGAELLLIGAAQDVVEEMGKIGEELEHYDKVEARRLTDKALYEDLHLSRKEHPPKPLLTGEWQ